MKKICFLIGNLNHSGGTERVTTMIANALVHEKYDISILSLIDGSQPFFELNPSIKYYSLYPRKISMKRNFLGAVWKIRKFVTTNNIDTFIVVDSISCIFSVPALWGLKIKHVCWEHFNFNVNLGIKYRDIGRKWAAKYCDYVVTLTKRDKELWQKALKKINAKVLAIANPTPYEDVIHTPSLEHKTVLAIGRLTYQKGFDLLIEAWSLVCRERNNGILRIVGSGEDEIVLKAQASRLGIMNRIDFVPTTKNVVQYYKTSSFYCLSSRFEGLPMVLLEAQSYGLPIVAFDCDTGPSDLIINQQNGFLVESENIYALAEKLIFALRMTDEEYRCFSNNAIFNSQKFSVNNLIEKWRAIL